MLLKTKKDMMTEKKKKKNNNNNNNNNMKTMINLMMNRSLLGIYSKYEDEKNND